MEKNFGDVVMIEKRYYPETFRHVSWLSLALGKKEHTIGALHLIRFDESLGLACACDGHRLFSVDLTTINDCLEPAKKLIGFYAVVKKTQKEIILSYRGDNNQWRYPDVSVFFPTTNREGAVEFRTGDYVEGTLYTRIVRTMKDTMSINYTFFKDLISFSDNEPWHAEFFDGRFISGNYHEAPVLFTNCVRVGLIMPVTI